MKVIAVQIENSGRRSLSDIQHDPHGAWVAHEIHGIARAGHVFVVIDTAEIAAHGQVFVAVAVQVAEGRREIEVVGRELRHAEPVGTAEWNTGSVAVPMFKKR